MSSSERCAWCKSSITDPADIITTTVKPAEDISYESSQHIDRIIFLQLENKPLTLANIFKDEDPFIGDHKAIPVFVVPFSDDNGNFTVKTCSRECAKSVRTSLALEKYVFRWNFENL